jgi:hypothetical protein
LDRSRSIGNQIRRVEKRLDFLVARHGRLVLARLAIAFGGGILVLGSWNRVEPETSGLIVLITLVLFIAAAFWHSRLKAAMRRHQLWRELKRLQLARLALDWDSIPSLQISAPDPDHPFAIDLDLIGDRSLHRLIDTAVSRGGSLRLRQWLLETDPDLEKGQQRQQLVREMAPMSRFRDKLLLTFRLVAREQLEGKKLVAWLDNLTPTRSLKTALFIVLGLAAVNLLLFGLHFTGRIPPYWQLSLVVYFAFFLFNRAKTAPLLEAAQALDDQLSKFRPVLRFLEEYRYGTSRALCRLCRPIVEQRPSRRLRRVTLITAAVGLRMNFLMAILLNIAVPWDFVCAYLMARQRDAFSRLLPAWLDLWYELEALSSLANLAYLNPGYVFPEFVEATGDGRILQARGIGHPLIPRTQKISNDFYLGESQAVIITGSNMAGKSTFIKTIGVNLALAYAGGPVDAGSLRLSMFRLFGCIRINDSVTEGVSTFYAEVRRLKRLLDALREDGKYPLFYLIDEIFRGTNNRERLIGSRAYIQTLIGQNGAGLISTHDLELAGLAQDHPSIRNYHFREEVLDGKMVFDYRLRPGPSPTTNALKIMRLEGLPVPT